MQSTTYRSREESSLLAGLSTHTPREFHSVRRQVETRNPAHHLTGARKPPRCGHTLARSTRRASRVRSMGGSSEISVWRLR
jgi:hypothetical protein